MDRRGFLGIMGLAAGAIWLGVRGLFRRGNEPPLKEAMHYKRADEQAGLATKGDMQ